MNCFRLDQEKDEDKSVWGKSLSEAYLHVMVADRAEKIEYSAIKAAEPIEPIGLQTGYSLFR